MTSNFTNFVNVYYGVCTKKLFYWFKFNKKESFYYKAIEPQ